MTVAQLKEAVLALEPEEKRVFITETLPDLAKDAMQDPSFLMQLLPIFLEIVRESGIDLQQAIRFAAILGGDNSGFEQK
jgi:hypothetical protein